MRTVWVTLFVVVAVLASSRASATSCFFAPPDEVSEPGAVLDPRADGRIYDEPTPPGGLAWLEILNDGDTGLCDDLEVRLRGEDFVAPDFPPGQLIDVDIVRVGPRAMAFRVPLDVAPGSVLDVTTTCSIGGSVGGRVVVAEPRPLEPPQLSIIATGTEILTVTTPACGFGDSEDVDNRTLIDVTVADASRDLLLDAWLVEPGAERPAETADRVTDAYLLPRDEPVLRIHVRTPGVFDAHLRLADVITGAVSDVGVVRVDTPESGPTGCSQASNDGFAALLLALLALRRRGAGPSCSRRGR